MKTILYLLLWLLILPAARSGAPTGQYYIPSDGSTLFIEQQENGAFSAEISLYRLTTQDDGIGEYKNGVLTVSATDSAGNPMVWEITRAEADLKAIVIHSSWELLPEGSEFYFVSLPEDGVQ